MERARNKLGRRGVLRAAVFGGAGTVVAGASATASGAPAAKRGPAGVRLRWLGVAGWQLTFDDHVLWFDPYLSRFDTSTLTVRKDVIENLLASGRIAGPPEVLMISHGHYDHIADVPYLLARPDWAGRILPIGTETHRHLIGAMGYHGTFIEARGGEQLSFANGAYTIRVIPSLHSQGKDYGYAFPGTLTAEPDPAPSATRDLLEGGTLAYLVTIPDRLSVLLFGGTNFVERELVGLRPDVVAVCMTFHNALDRYLERLLTVLGGPPYVLPSHHDDMVTGFDDPNLPNTVHASAVAELKDTVRALRLRTEVLAPPHLTDVQF